MLKSKRFSFVIVSPLLFLLFNQSCTSSGPSIGPSNGEKNNGERGPNKPNGPRPQILPPNPNASIANIKPLQAIPASAADYQQMITQWSQAYLSANAAESAKIKFTYMPYDLITNPNGANMARIAVWKALNSVAINIEDIYIGPDVSNGYGIIYAIHLNSLWLEDGLKNWNFLATAKGTDDATAAGRSRTSEKSFDSLKPVSMQALTYNAVAPRIYAQLIKMPGNEGRLRKNNDMLPKVQAWNAQNDAIVFGPRVSWMKVTEDGRKYWATGDKFRGSNSKDTKLAYLKPGVKPIPRFQNRNRDMLFVDQPYDGDRTAASEAWLEMKNGLISYYIWGAGSQRRTAAEFSFVGDPENHFKRQNTVQGIKVGRLLTGRSCIASCHVNGPIARLSDMATAFERGEIPAEYVQEASKYWTSNQRLKVLYSESTTRFQTAMRKIVINVSNGTPDQNGSWIQGKPEAIRFFIDRVDPPPSQRPQNNGRQRVNP